GTTRVNVDRRAVDEDVSSGVNHDAARPADDADPFSRAHDDVLGGVEPDALAAGHDLNQVLRGDLEVLLRFEIEVLLRSDGNRSPAGGHSQPLFAYNRKPTLLLDVRHRVALNVCIVITPDFPVFVALHQHVHRPLGLHEQFLGPLPV